MSFGKKKVDFCGIVSPACAKRATCSTVTGCSRNAAAASPRSTVATASSAYAVYETPCGANDSTTRGPKSSSVATRVYMPSR